MLQKTGLEDSLNIADTIQEVKMTLIIILSWFVLLLVFAGAPAAYYMFLRRASSKNWNLRVDQNYLPTVTIMVPMYNEEKTITMKLENLIKLKYPRERLEILLVNDGSKDRTEDEISNFLTSNGIEMTALHFPVQRGKTVALNDALKHAKGEILVISDSDVFLSPEVLYKAMPFLADPSVGAVMSREELLNPDLSWVTKSEKLYYKLVYGTVKLGESKIHSTLMFHGGFAAYRRSFMENFHLETDDTGTALDIVQKGGRTIMVPDAVSFSMEFTRWRDKSRTKIRRAVHNLKTWLRCLRLLFGRKLLLPKRIAFPEIFLYLINPIVFLTLLIMTVPLLLSYPLMAVFVFPAVFCILAVNRSRIAFVELVQNNVFLLLGILSIVTGKTITLWKTSQEPRAMTTRELLRSHDLV